jgi:hypothetical protein
MPDNNPNPLEYHYKTSIKLDYFILSANIALLGWTIVNTGWLPQGNIFIWLISGFWALIILSVICGVIRQLYNGMIFGLNYQILEAGELASVIERSGLQGGEFINQQTGDVKPTEKFKNFAIPHRTKEEKGKKLYEKFEKRSAFFANLAVVLLVVALFLLAGIKIYVLTI